MKKGQYIGRKVEGDECDGYRKLGDFVIGRDLLEDNAALPEIKKVVELFAEIEKRAQQASILFDTIEKKDAPLGCVLVKDLLKDMYESCPDEKLIKPLLEAMYVEYPVHEKLRATKAK